MSRPFPYTFISCPCADSPDPIQDRDRDRPTNDSDNANKNNNNNDNEDEEEGGTFDPRSPRANFSLFPPEHLLYCEECHQIKCPRCITEEILSWYCPNCLFETPSSTLRSEGNR